jgi:hypothetical protein
MRKAEDKFILDRDYNGFLLCTNGKIFYTQDDAGNRLFEAATLDALKTKCRKPKELNIAAVILEPGRYYWDSDDEANQPQIVRVYGVSPTGAFLYESKGKKDKTSRGGSDLRQLRVADGSDVAEYVRLRKLKIEAAKALEEYTKNWPTMKATDFLGGNA